MNPEPKIDRAKVIDFYKPELRGDSLYITAPKQWFVPWSDKPLFLSFGQKKVKDFDEARAKGFYETTCREFHRLVLGDEQFNELRKTKELDDRTREYFDQVKASIGMLDRKDGWDGEKFEVEFQLPVWMNLTGSGEVDCGQIEDGRWVAEWSVRTDIDDYNITDIYFDRKPTEEMVLTAQLLFDAKFFLTRRRYDPSFSCCECGRPCEHWLDIPFQTLRAKFGAFQEESYCGCGDEAGEKDRSSLDGRVQTFYVGFDGEKVVDSATTQQQIDSVLALQCDLQNDGERITWEVFDNPDEPRTVFQAILADRRIRVDQKTAMADRPSIAVITGVDGKAVRLEFYEGHDALSPTYDVRSAELKDKELPHFMDEDPYAYDPVKFLAEAFGFPEEFTRPLLDAVHQRDSNKREGRQ